MTDSRLVKPGFVGAGVELEGVVAFLCEVGLGI